MISTWINFIFEESKFTFRFKARIKDLVDQKTYRIKSTQQNTKLEPITIKILWISYTKIVEELLESNKKYNSQKSSI